MAKKKYDMIIEAVHYASDGSIHYARGYQRRGDTYSDHVLVSRQALIQLLQSGKHVAVGTRQQGMASTFVISDTVHVADYKGTLLLRNSSQTDGEKDRLKGVPVF